MSKKENGTRRQGRMTRQTLIQYLLSLAGYSVSLILLVFLARFVLGMFTWQSGPVYNFFNVVRDNIVLILALLMLAGWFFISCLFIRRPLRYLDQLADAAAQLASPSETPIRLAPAMKTMEDELNLVQAKALRSALAAREAEQRKNDLIVYLAHDLKTPLTSVIGYLSLLQESPELSPELRARYTGVALDKALRLEDLINEFFDITRFNLSHLELELAPVDLSRMLQQVASEFEPQLAEQDLRCQLELPPSLPYLCDPDKLARVFDNLLRNACHYSFPGSVITIRGEQGPAGIRLFFQNAGRTIPKEKLERLFDQFFRLDSSRATRTGGAGLGLAIAKEIVELHGGSIRAQSADNLVTFTLCLPPAAP